MAANETTITDWAQALVSQIRAHEPFGAPWTQLSIDEAYEVQDEVRRLLEPERGPLGGYKIAAGAKPLQEMLGIDRPLGGQIHAGQLRVSSPGAPASISAADFVRVALECEVLVRMAADVPPSTAPYTRETIAPFVGELIVSFEVLDTRAAAIPSLGAAGLVADRCGCEGAVLGTVTSGLDGVDVDRLGELAAELEWNGEIADRGVTGNAMGHPFEGLAWVANHVAERGGQLKAGQVVLTGAAFPPKPAAIGDVVTYRIVGLGEVSVRIEA